MRCMVLRAEPFGYIVPRTTSRRISLSTRERALSGALGQPDQRGHHCGYCSVACAQSVLPRPEHFIRGREHDWRTFDQRKGVRIAPRWDWSEALITYARSSLVRGPVACLIARGRMARSQTPTCCDRLKFAVNRIGGRP
jgi:hypothetical protein